MSAEGSSRGWEAEGGCWAGIPTGQEVQASCKTLHRGIVFVLAVFDLPVILVGQGADVVDLIQHSKGSLNSVSQEHPVELFGELLFLHCCEPSSPSKL